MHQNLKHHFLWAMRMGFLLLIATTMQSCQLGASLTTAPSSNKQINSFKLTPAGYPGTIDQNARTIAVTIALPSPYGYDLSACTAAKYCA